MVKYSKEVFAMHMVDLIEKKKTGHVNRQSKKTPKRKTAESLMEYCKNEEIIFILFFPPKRSYFPFYGILYDI